MPSWLLTCLVVALFLLHQDAWFWRTARPVVLGVLPISLFYHVVYCLAASLLMWALVRHAWPSRLEREAEGADLRRDGRQ